MGILERIAPRFEGGLDLPGEGSHFLDDLERQGFSPTGFSGPRAKYAVRRQGAGLLVEAQDRLTAWNVGLEWVALLADPLPAGGFRLLYEVRFPRWARFCWTISLCTTWVPLAAIVAAALFLGGLVPAARPATLEPMTGLLFALIVVPFLLFGLLLPPLLVVLHRPRARGLLERVLRARAEAVAAEDRPRGG